MEVGAMHVSWAHENRCFFLIIPIVIVIEKRPLLLLIGAHWFLLS